jgi:hypothetical protein
MTHFESSAVAAFSASIGALFSAINARCINFRDKVPLLSIPGFLGGGGIWLDSKNDLDPSLAHDERGTLKIDSFDISFVDICGTRSSRTSPTARNQSAIKGAPSRWRSAPHSRRVRALSLTGEALLALLHPVH